MAESQRKAAYVPPGGGAPLAWVGERLRYLLVGEQTEAQCALALRTLPPGGSIAPHILHRTHVGHFVLDGELTATAGPRQLTLPAGGFLGIGPGTRQQLMNTGMEPVELLTVSGPAGLDEYHFRSGVPLPKAESPTPDVTDADREIAASLAPGYGLDLHPPEATARTEAALRLTLPGEGKTLAVLGDLYRFLATSEDTAGRYALFHATIAPGNGPPWHAHAREDEAFYVLRGQVTFEADGTVLPSVPGGFVHLPRGSRHRFVNETTEPAELLILAAPGGLETLFDAIGRPWHDAAQFPEPPDRSEIERLIDEAPKHGIELFG